MALCEKQRSAGNCITAQMVFLAISTLLRMQQKYFIFHFLTKYKTLFKDQKFVFLPVNQGHFKVKLVSFHTAHVEWPQRQ